MNHLTVTVITEQVRDFMARLYQERLAGVVLFGSQARGEAEPDSDIDLLIVLRGAFHYYEEVRRIGGFVSDLCLDHDVLVSCCFTTEEQWLHEDSAFYRNVHRDGVIL
ncbi:nucleotidyltransferase domain-containing protein [Spirulina major CS-329]|uniref:nucleotidyltransferase domain-containing protein n=1 Tax=Spirulina TaxID=1154 RepID=UPI00232E8F51|nr:MULTISPECIES: nucleotidyltransferase domain-containing protein [Spirulina]MDB9494660.1 nucleotidyltransferase domain-containing protein [Spirulina subsalsa CS-330]MDB9503681.1 nucleotidyltransferase domain-containing protein [Spirulina major CS-329]